MSFSLRVPFLAFLSLFVFGGQQALAENGVTPTEIKIGVVNVTSGPIAASGQSLTDGTKAYLDKVNREGGINGRKFSMIHYDDKYEPRMAAELTEKAINEDKVFALLSANGTPTAKAVLPIIKNAKVPYLFPRTGDPATREPFDKYVFNMRSSFSDEMDALIEYTIKGGKKKIAVLTQKDAFGDTIKSGARKAMSKRGIAEFIAEGLVDRNSMDIKEAFAKIDSASPDSVVMAVTAAAALPFIKMALANGKKWEFLNANNNNSLVDSLPKDMKADVIISQVVPNPVSSGLPISKEFRAEMKTFGKPDLDDDLNAFEGYINAAAFSEAVKRSGKELTRDSLIAAFEASPMDLGGYQVAWSAHDHNGKSAVFLTKIQAQKLIDLK
jgi:branched-chain amino acid transport system substrate-binding protein